MKPSRYRCNNVSVLHHPPLRRRSLPPLLFIHGGYVDARCWEMHFLPYFADLGYDCHAIDLSGHGASPGADCIDSFGIDDFVEDTVEVIDALAEPVVIGHSMGAVIAERILEAQLAVAGILMSPVPPGGTAGSIVGLALHRPDFFAEISRITHGRMTRHNLEMMREVYFSPEMPVDDLIQFGELIQPESQRAVAELATLGMRLVFSRPRLPVLVVGGEYDSLFSPSLLPLTARRWNGTSEVVAGAGHVIMLDPQWRDCADCMAAWLAGISGSSHR